MPECRYVGTSARQTFPADPAPSTTAALLAGHINIDVFLLPYSAQVRDLRTKRRRRRRRYGYWTNWKMTNDPAVPLLVVCSWLILSTCWTDASSGNFFVCPCCQIGGHVAALRAVPTSPQQPRQKLTCLLLFISSMSLYSFLYWQCWGWRKRKATRDSNETCGGSIRLRPPPPPLKRATGNLSTTATRWETIPHLSTVILVSVSDDIAQRLWNERGPSSFSLRNLIYSLFDISGLIFSSSSSIFWLDSPHIWRRKK